MAHPHRKPARRSIGSGGISRRDFIRTMGVGAAALGASSTGLGGLARAMGEPSVAGECSGHYYGFDNAVPDGVTLGPQLPITHPNYDMVTSHFGYNVQCGNENLTSLCIPHYCYDIKYSLGGLYAGGIPEQDFGLLPRPQYVLPNIGQVPFIDYFFATMDLGVPYPFSGPFGLNIGQFWAYALASVAFFQLEHRGPLGALASESQIPKPSALGQEFAPLDNMYTPVGFDVNYPLFASPQNPTGIIKLFGYFFKGKGVWKGEKVYKPLIFIMSGITDYLEKPGPVTGGFRKLVAGFVNRGFNVLYVDKPGHGWSHGFVGTVSGKMFFEVLRQLDGKVDMMGEPLLGLPVKQTPIILAGHSLGAIFNQAVMALNTNPQLVPLANLPSSYTGQPGDQLGYGQPFDLTTADLGYQFKGMIDIEGLPGGLKFSSSGLIRLISGFRTLMRSDATLRQATYMNMVPAMSEWVATVPYWPALMVVTTTQNYQAPEGARHAYNLATGLKRILILEGEHSRAFVQPNVNILLQEALKFAEAAVENPGASDTSQISMPQLICGTPYIRTDVTPAPPGAGHLASYYAELARAAAVAAQEMAKE